MSHNYGRVGGSGAFLCVVRWASGWMDFAILGNLMCSHASSLATRIILSK